MLLETVAEAFAAVGGDQDQPLVLGQEVEACVHLGGQGAVGAQAVNGVEQRVDHGVAGDEDSAVLQPFAQQIGAGAVGRGEQYVGHAVDDACGSSPPARAN